jgi:hypothetical protein
MLSSVGDSAPGWADSKTIRVAEYYYVTSEKVQGKARKYYKRTVKWAKINAIEPIEERRKYFSGKFIPMLEVVGDDLIVDGKRYTAGMVRDGKGPNLFYDYMVSAAAETLALAAEIAVCWAERALLPTPSGKQRIRRTTPTSNTIRWMSTAYPARRRSAARPNRRHRRQRRP